MLRCHLTRDWILMHLNLQAVLDRGQKPACLNEITVVPTVNGSFFVFFCDYLWDNGCLRSVL